VQEVYSEGSQFEPPRNTSSTDWDFRAFHRLLQANSEIVPKIMHAMPAFFHMLWH
jgi:hypothetical protein